MLSCVLSWLMCCVIDDVVMLSWCVVVEKFCWLIMLMNSVRCGERKLFICEFVDGLCGICKIIICFCMFLC